MANKKITVVGDGAEEPLTPEEEHRIEVKVDQMLDPGVPDEPLDAAAKAEKNGPSMPAAPTEAPAPKPEAPMVTKIVTTFADDEPARPAPAPPVAKPKPEPATLHKAKPTAKKIAVKHHEDDEVAEEPKKSVAKHAKVKSTAKKTTKKLKVTVADGSETDDLASKADAIAAAAQAAEEQLNTPEPVQEDNAEVVPAKEAKTLATNEEPEILVEATETSEDSADGAPPLIQKHSAAPIGAPLDTDIETPEPPKTAATSRKIAVLHDELEDQVPEPAAEQPSKAETTTEPKEVVEIPVEEMPEAAEEIAVEVEPDTAPKSKTKSESAEAKKYRPPDGPIQFKRAEVPIQPHKPGEPRVDEVPTKELSEDEAIAQAFETKSSGGSDTVQQLIGGLVKVAKWTLILGIIAGVAAVGAVPNLRHKALNLIGVDTTTSAAKTKAATNNSAAVAAGQDVYIANRGGVYNIYRSNLDGQNEKLVLAGTGKETSNLVLAPNTSDTIAALVSTRDGKEDASGDVQQTLTLISVSNGATTITDTADQVKLIDWFGDYIVYTVLNTSTSTTDTNRYQLISYNTASKVRTVLDHAAYLNDVLSAKGSVYYATAASTTSTSRFMKIQPDASAPKTILSSEIAAITRTSYDTVLLSSINKWYSYELGSLQATPTSNVGQSVSRQYIDSPDGKHSVYLHTEGSSPQLKLVDTVTSKETDLSVTSASYPIRWLGNDTILYRSNGADYSMKIGGQSSKIADVFEAAGISLWHQK